MTNAQTGAMHGSYFPEASPTSGMPPCTLRRPMRACSAPAPRIRAQIIWAKERLVIGHDDYHWQHEPCWYAVRKKGQLDRRSASVTDALEHP